MLYAILLDSKSHGTFSYQRAWNRDCNLQYTPTQWETLWSSYAYTSNNNIIKIQSFKVLTIWYLSPKLLSHILSNSSPLCWKGCGLPADIFHCWWSCKFIQVFWKNIFKLINKITSYELPFQPEVAFLNVLQDSSILLNSKNLISILLTVAKQCVAHKWKVSHPPNVTLWTDKLWTFFIFEKNSDRLKLQELPLYHSTLADIWLPVLEYLNGNDFVQTKLTKHEYLKSFLYF